jgi:serine/threonine protein kinase
MSYESTELTSKNSSTTELDIWTGYIFNKKYMSILKIGGGSVSSVWLTYNMTDKKYYAMKIQNTEKYNNWIQEIKIIKLISENSKHLCHMVDKFEFTRNKDKYVCMVLPLYVGSIDDLLHTPKYKNGFPEKLAKKILKQIFDGLAELHDKYKLIHTDMKPENVMICGNNKCIDVIRCQIDKNLKSLIKMSETKRIEFISKLKYNTKDITIDEKFPKVCIIDFGNVKYAKDEHTDEIQTRYYRAPEVILGHQYDEKVDIWSVGCIYYEMLTGNILFDTDDKYKNGTDRYHLYMIQKYIDKISPNLIEKSPYRFSFFTINGTIKGINTYECVSINNELIKSMLCIEPDKRAKAKDLANLKEIADLIE